MISFIFRTDTHVSDRSPASWKADYPAEVWSNLEQIGLLAKQHGVKAVLDGGDFFHVKAASRNSHALVVRTASIHNVYPCPTYSVEGNHDLAYNNLESIERQPLGVLYESGIFRMLREQVFEEDGVRVRVVGVPYSHSRTLADLLMIRKKPGDTFLIAVVHALASENPPPHVEDFFGEAVFRYADLAFQDGPDMFCLGHWHKDQGIVSVADTTFVNHGAVSRGALINENIQRTPKVALIEADRRGLRVTSIPLLVAPAEDVFDLERKQRVEEENKSIDQFVLRLQQDGGFDASLSIEENVQSLGFAQDVREAALQYLDLARSEVG